jgi:hypothetical protein
MNRLGISAARQAEIWWAPAEPPFVFVKYCEGLYPGFGSPHVS